MTTIRFIGDVRSDIEAVESGLDTKEKIRNGVTDAISIASEMTSEAHARVDAIMNHRLPRRKRRAWRNDQLLNDYFGDNASVVQIRAVRRRINRARRRLRANKLRIRLLPQDRATNDSTNGHNKGGPFSPRTFVLFPAWFGIIGREERAAIVFHELLHDWLIDQKLNGTTVRCDTEAQELADDRPSKARRNPENYEQFALRLRLNSHARLSELSSFRAGPRPIPAGQLPRPDDLTPAF